MDYYGLREFDAKIFRGSREKLHASAVKFHLSEEKKVAPSALYGRSMHADWKKSGPPKQVQTSKHLDKCYPNNIREFANFMLFLYNQKSRKQ